MVAKEFISEDVKDLKFTLEYSDLNINTCYYEFRFIQLGKPVINTVFGNSNGLYDDQKIFKICTHKKKLLIVKLPKNLKNKRNC
jgi:hypothetical protein